MCCTAAIARAAVTHFVLNASSSRPRPSKDVSAPLSSANSAEEVQPILPGSLLVPVAQRLARLVLALLEPQHGSLAAWGFFNACFEQKEQIERYVAEQIAREMLAATPRCARVRAGRSIRSSPQMRQGRLEFSCACLRHRISATTFTRSIGCRSSRALALLIYMYDYGLSWPKIFHARSR